VVHAEETLGIADKIFCSPSCHEISCVKALSDIK